MADNKLRIGEVPDGLVVAGRNVMSVTRASGFVASEAAGEWGMGTYTSGRLTPSHDEIAELAFRLYEHVTGEMGTTLKIGCLPNRYSSSTKRM